ncbi:c-type cytochrome [Frateuria aurantia]
MKKKVFAVVGAGVACAVLGVLLYQNNTTADDAVASKASHAADAAALDPAAVARGRYVAITSDCVACHTAPGSRDAFAGGYRMQTPFGVIESSNITPDRSTGIGNWSERQFYDAVRHGQAPEGYLYPAMPYNAYVKLSDQDMHDLWAYIRSVKPVAHKVDSNQLPFPYNIRLAMAGWNLLFYRNQPFTTTAGQSAEWNRGAYLVEGPGHCAACHTSKNALGGDRASGYLQGYRLQGWFAPEIAGNPHVGLGNWSLDDITSYLKTGSNGRSVASGPMAEAVTNSTQYITDADLRAMAVYLKSVKGSSDEQTSTDAALPEDVAKRGQHLYEANCSACHNTQGQGVEGMVTGFAGNPGVQSKDASSLIHTVLDGGRAAVTVTNPTGAGMPSFAWKMSDADIADVLSYVRSAWGNRGSRVTADEVAAARSSLHSGKPFTQSH